MAGAAARLGRVLRLVLAAVRAVRAVVLGAAVVVAAGMFPVLAVVRVPGLLLVVVAVVAAVGEVLLVLRALLAAARVNGGVSRVSSAVKNLTKLRRRLLAVCVFTKAAVRRFGCAGARR